MLATGARRNIVMAHIVMVHTIMAHIVMAYVVMAHSDCARYRSWCRTSVVAPAADITVRASAGCMCAVTYARVCIEVHMCARMRLCTHVII